MIRKESDRLKMIERALKDQAPGTYRDLKKAGHLESFLKERDSLLVESYDQARARGILAPSKTEDFLERVQEINEADRRAWEEALATYLEFSDGEGMIDIDEEVQRRLEIAFQLWLFEFPEEDMEEARELWMDEMREGERSRILEEMEFFSQQE